MEVIAEQDLEHPSGHRFRVRVAPDPYAPSPRLKGDGLIGRLCLRHARYELPDEDPRLRARLDRGDLPAPSWPAVQRWIRSCRGASVVLPVYGYDHSGLAVRTGPFADPWDSGLLGVVFDDPAQVRDLGVPVERVEQELVAEVARFDTWLQGRFCRYQLQQWVPACEHGHPQAWVPVDIDGDGALFADPHEALAEGLAEARRHLADVPPHALGGAVGSASSSR